MRIVIYVLLGICAVLILVCYSMVVIADRANRRAERMYRKWRESKSGKDIPGETE